MTQTLRASIGANDEIRLAGDIEPVEAKELTEIVRDAFNKGIAKGFAAGVERGKAICGHRR